MTISYSKRLKTQTSTLKNNLCLGIDLHFRNLPPFLEQIRQKKNTISTAEEYCKILINVASNKIPAVKFQTAFFEALGHEGFKLLKEMIHYSKRKNLLSILDAKRGDVASTMEAYGFMAFELMQADALTLSPYMGGDVLRPLLKWLKQGCGVYTIFLSSNPSGHKLQNSYLADQRTLVADLFLEPMIKLLKKEKLETSLGLVVGATCFNELPQTLRDSITRFSLLIPGIGAQGGTFSTQLSSIVHQQSPHLFTISRELTGLGSEKLSKTLWKIKNTDEYASFLEKRIALYVNKAQ